MVDQLNNPIAYRECPKKISKVYDRAHYKKGKLNTKIMKKLRLKKTSFADAEVLSRAQLRKIIGGDVGDVYECSGDKWNGTTFRFEKETKNCFYAPPIGTLPGAYLCPLTTGYYNVTGCSKKSSGGVGSGTVDV